MSQHLQEKIRDYKQFLNRTYLEFREVGYLFSGVIPKGYFAYFHQDIADKFGIKGFGAPIEVFDCLFPNQSEDELLKNGASIHCLLLSSIEEKEITAHSIKISQFKYTDEFSQNNPYFQGHTYIISPDEAVFAAVTKGLILPKELQDAYGIRQISKPMVVVSKGLENKIKRYTLAQGFRWTYPEETISSLCRRGKRLAEIDRGKKVRYFDFWPSGIGHRAREPFQKIKPANPGEIPFIPGVMKKQDGILCLDFQLLKIVLNCVADLIILKQQKINSTQLLQHPLIKFYGEVGGPSVQKIVRFCLKKTLDYLDVSKWSPKE